MRPLLTLILTAGLLGGTWCYTSFVNRIVPQPNNFRVKLANETYSLEILRTFDAVSDSDSETSQLETDATARSEEHALLVLFQGEALMALDDVVPASQHLEIAAIPGIEVGENEVFFKARLAPPAPNEFHAMQVRVLKGGREIGKSTFSSYPGCSLIYGRVLIEAAEETDF